MTELLTVTVRLTGRAVRQASRCGGRQLPVECTMLIPDLTTMAFEPGNSGVRPCQIRLPRAHGRASLGSATHGPRPVYGLCHPRRPAKLAANPDSAPRASVAKRAFFAKQRRGNAAAVSRNAPECGSNKAPRSASARCQRGIHAGCRRRRPLKARGVR